MTRIATNISNQSALAELLRNQRDLVTAQNQLASGKKATDLKGLAKEAASLTSAQALKSRNEGFTQAAKEVSGRLATQDLALNEAAGAAADLRQALTDALALDNGNSIMQQLGAVFDRATNALNQKFAGRSLFGGTRTDVNPVNIATLNDLAAAPTIASIFSNTQVKPTARVEDGPPFEVGFLADKVGTELFTVIRDIKAFNDGASGPFGTSLTAAQKTFLQTTLASVITANDNLNIEVSKNGLLQNRVSAAQDRSEGQQNLLVGIIGDLQDADLAQTATRLQQAQTAVEASARTFSLLSQLSLLNFLR